jgi:hypothetical protein
MKPTDQIRRAGRSRPTPPDPTLRRPGRTSWLGTIPACCSTPLTALVRSVGVSNIIQYTHDGFAPAALGSDGDLLAVVSTLVAIVNWQPSLGRGQFSPMVCAVDPAGTGSPENRIRAGRGLGLGLGLDREYAAYGRISSLTFTVWFVWARMTLLRRPPGGLQQSEGPDEPGGRNA